MARASSVVPCLICQQMPCECDKPAAKPRARKARPSPEVNDPSPEPTVTDASPPSTSRESMLARMRARAAQAPTVSVEPVRAKPTAASSELRALAPDDALEVAAIRTLSNFFEVEGEAVDRWRPYLDKPRSRPERAAAWKMSREGHAQ